MKFIDQSAKELRLNLVNSNYSEKELSVLTRETSFFKEYNIEYGILGASHFLKIFNANVTFAEVFACIELELESSVLFTGNMENREVSFFNDWLDYNFASSILEWSSSSQKKYNYFEENSSSSFIFPLQEEYNFLAKTQVIFKLTSDILHLETMHAYPNENKLVFTETKIKIKEK